MKKIEYKFYYFVKGKEFIKICKSEREAEVFFDILVSAKLVFKVYTLIKK